MDHPEGASLQRADRLDFDPRVRVEFRGMQLSSDGGRSSVRDSAARAMLLFGDRMVPADFSVESVRLVETDPTLLDAMNETAARCGSFIAR